MHVAIRTDGDPRALIPAVRAALRDIDPQKPAYGLTPLGDPASATMVRDPQAMVASLLYGVQLYHAGWHASTPALASTVVSV